MNLVLSRKGLVFVVVGLFIAVSIVPVNSLSIDPLSSKVDGMFENNSLFNSTCPYPVDGINIDERLSEREDNERDLYERYPWHYDRNLRNQSDYPFDEPFLDYPNYEEYSGIYSQKFNDEYVKNHALKDRKPIPKPNFAAGKTWYVDDDGGQDFTRIQEAINASQDGDTVFVYNGFYQENVDVDKSIILEGEDKNNTVVDAGGGGFLDHAFNIEVNHVHITGFGIKNSGKQSPLIYCSSNYNVINNNIFSEFNDLIGILFWEGNQNEFTNNFLYGNLANSWGGSGATLCLYESNNNIIKSNKFFVNGGLIIVSNNNNTPQNQDVEGNTVNNKPLIYMQGVENKIITFNEQIGQLILYNCKDIDIYGLNISKAIIGISIIHSRNCHLFESGIANCTIGIEIYRSHWCKINNIFLVNCNYYESRGIEIWYCDNISLDRNIFENVSTNIRIGSSENISCLHNIITNTYSRGFTITESKYLNIEYNTIQLCSSVKDYYHLQGIYIIDCCKNTIKGNNITGFLNGLYMGDVNSTLFIQNDIKLCYNSGIYMFDSRNNTIEGTNITSSRNEGIYMRNSKRNVISKNNIINNFGCGIQISSHSSYNTIIDNNIASNIKNGIFLENSDNNTISSCIIDGHILGFGIQLMYSNNIDIIYNLLLNNKRGGIKIGPHSSKNNIKGCIFHKNSWGIDLINSQKNHIEKCTIANNFNGGVLEGENNTIIKNNFINNYNHYFHQEWNDTNIFFRNYWSGHFTPLPYRIFNLKFDWFPRAIPYIIPLIKMLIDNPSNQLLDQWREGR